MSICSYDMSRDSKSRLEHEEASQKSASPRVENDRTLIRRAQIRDQSRFYHKGCRRSRVGNLLYFSRSALCLQGEHGSPETMSRRSRLA